MYNFIIFDAAGKITQKGTVQDKDCVTAPDGHTKIEFEDQLSVDFNDDYFDGFNVVKRPAFPAKVTSLISKINETIVISDIPSPSKVKIDGVEYDVLDGSIILTSDVAAKYTIEAEQWPYLPWSIDVKFTE